MRAYWKSIEARFGRLSLREQALVSLVCMALIYTVIDTLLLSPMAVRQKRLAQELAQKRQEADTLSAQVAGLKSKQGEDPEAVSRRRLAGLESQLASAQAAIREQSALLVSADRMPGVLERLVANRRGLDLVELKTLPRSLIDLGNDPKQASKPEAATASPGTAPADKSGSDAPRNIYRYGVELSIRGGYLDLLGYLRDVESLPGRVYWERMELEVAEFPVAILKLRLFTISFDSVWMKV